MSVKSAVLSAARSCLPVLLGASALCGHAASAGPNVFSIKASVDTEEVLGFDLDRCPGTGIVGTTTGRGNASHLGSVTMVGSDCPLLPYGTPSFSNGLLVLKAANGDELRASYQGTLTPIGNSTTDFSISGTFAVSGGTGRLLNATGSGALQGTIKLSPRVSIGSYQFNGTIAY